MSADSLSAWLALREAADAAARSAIVTRTICDRFAGAGPLHVLDLAAGTGSNLRYLAPHLPGEQRWLLVDRDQQLLEEAARRMPALASYQRCTVERRRLDLATLDHPDIFAGRQLVTASALLDLVSERWLDELAARCRAVGATALFALTYNGWSRCSPAEPEDERVRELMNRHQRTDKGLGGPAAGPDGAVCAERSLAAAGYRVQRDTSNWTLPPDLRALQRRLVEGWAQAAVEIEPAEAPIVQDWLARRLAHVDAGRSHIVVGHDDLAAWPT
jgi:hypothetical protein